MSFLATVELVALPCIVNPRPALRAQCGYACILSPASSIFCCHVLVFVALASTHRALSRTAASPVGSSLNEDESSPFIPSISSRLGWLCPLIVDQNYCCLLEGVGVLVATQEVVCG